MNRQDDMKKVAGEKTALLLNQEELAKKLGVSQMTISRVLHDRPGVSLKLKKKILLEIEKCGYVLDHLAAGLRNKLTHTIGLIIPDVSNSFFPEITAAIEDRAKERGYRVILAHSHEVYEQEVNEVNLLRGFRVDGFIIAPAGQQDEVDIYGKLQTLSIPFVFVDRLKKGVPCSSVVTDIEDGAFQLGRYLLAKGYRRWGCLLGPKGISSSDAFFEGLCQVFRETGRDPRKIVSVKAGFSEADGQKMTAALLKKIKPEVILAVNDCVAIGAYRYLKENRIKVPDDIAITGFSNLKSTDILEVPLTTVEEPTREIGQRAFDLLCERIEDSSVEVQMERLKPHLIVRASA
jgi:DNA-binding LacI/PurR family transcriptional regulator